MAPITAGVESPTTPPAAMRLASTSSTQNCDVLARRAPEVRNSASSISSSGLTVLTAGVDRPASQPMSLPPLRRRGDGMR
jgi:hypothetical protein